MVIKINLVKTNDIVNLIKYQFPDSNEWHFVTREFQALSQHSHLTSMDSVSTIIEQMVNYRTIQVRLSEDEAIPYINGDYTDLCEIEDDSDVAPASVSRESNLLDKVSEMMRIQQEMLKVVLTKLNNSSSSTQANRQRLEVSKFDGKDEAAKSWLITYGKDYWKSLQT